MGSRGARAPDRAGGGGELGWAGDAGATAHYADPAYYSKTYADRRHDVEFYTRAAKSSRGPVLEYGIGNGRVALAMARAGVEVVGVDLSEPMLRDLEERLGREPRQVRERVSWVEGDMRTVRLGRRFPLVIAPFNTILHLYRRSEIEDFFARVREHLAPGGRFVFDFSVPQGGDLIRDPERAYRVPRFRHPTTGEVVSYAERFKYDPLRQLLTVSMEFTPQGGTPWTVPLTHRQFFPREMEALLHYAGFGEITFFADFTPREPDASVDSLVVSCRRARRPRIPSSSGSDPKRQRRWGQGGLARARRAP